MSHDAYVGTQLSSAHRSPWYLGKDSVFYALKWKAPHYANAKLHHDGVQYRFVDIKFYSRGAVDARSKYRWVCCTVIKAATQNQRPVKVGMTHPGASLLCRKHGVRFACTGRP
jgi:hypothetical protein